MTPEERQRLLLQQMEVAQRSGDASAILALMTEGTKTTVSEYIKRSIGHLKYSYYLFLDTFHKEPYDIDDMLDGILYIDAKAYLEKDAREKAKDRAERLNKK